MFAFSPVAAPSLPDDDDALRLRPAASSDAGPAAAAGGTGQPWHTRARTATARALRWTFSAAALVAVSAVTAVTLELQGHSVGNGGSDVDENDVEAALHRQATEQAVADYRKTMFEIQQINSARPN
jgi:hypothetical protein